MFRLLSRTLRSTRVLRKQIPKVFRPTSTKFALGTMGVVGGIAASMFIANAEFMEFSEDLIEYDQAKQEAADLARVRSWRDPSVFKSKHSLRILTGDGDIACTQEEFLNIIQKDHPFRVISVIGPLKNGKSHFLNSLFFDGKEVFATSNEDESTTKGCWAAQSGDLLAIDCEGLMDPAQDIQETENRKQTLQLILAVSDVVVYICASPTLDQAHANLIEEVSEKYMTTVAEDLKTIQIIQKTDIQNAGPSFIIYHRRPNDHVKPHTSRRISSIFRSRHVPTYNNGGAFRNFQYQESLAELNFCKEKDLFSLPLPRLISHELESECLRRPQNGVDLFQSLTVLSNVYKGNAPTIDMKSIYRKSYSCTAKCKISDCKSECTKHFRHKICPVCGFACGKIEHDVNKRFDHSSSRPCRKDQVHHNYTEMCNLCREEGRPSVPLRKELDVDQTEMILTLGISPAVKFLYRGYVYKCPAKHNRVGTERHYFVLENNLPIYEEIDHIWDDQKN